MQDDFVVRVLDAFAKLRKATISFVCLNVLPRGTLRLPMEDFLI
jgi:hypothetical protein